MSIIKQNPSNPLNSTNTLTIRRPTNDSTGNRLTKRIMNRHGTAQRTRPILCVINNGQFHLWSSATALPFNDASFIEINLEDTLEHVRDDEQLIDELARISSPGANLHIRVPNSGPLTAFDSYNLYHYFRAISHRGEHLPVTDEIGWRRHYGVDMLVQLLDSQRFTITDVRSSGTGATELIEFMRLLLLRGHMQNDRYYSRTAHLTQSANRIAPRLPMRKRGFWLDITAIRLAR